MSEHVSGYDGTEEHLQLPPTPEELDEMNRAADAIVFEMQTDQQIALEPPGLFEEVPFSVEAGHWIGQEDSSEDYSPVWGIEPLDEQLEPDEAPTQRQREHARHYFLTLTSLAERRYRHEETISEPQELSEAHAVYMELIEREDQNLHSSERLPHFSLTHLWSAARRHNAWVTRWMQEQQIYNAPEQFEEALFILLNTESRLADAVGLLE
jgi:hypothetical protein